MSGLVGAAAGVKVQALTALLSPLKGTASESMCCCLHVVCVLAVAGCWLLGVGKCGCWQAASPVTLRQSLCQSHSTHTALCPCMCRAVSVWLAAPATGTMLASLDAVRDAAEVSLTAFFGLLLDNTKV